VSALGRELQVLLKNQFSESYLNKILQLILANIECDSRIKKTITPDTVICKYQLSLSSLPDASDFLEYKKMLDRKFTGKSCIIILEILTGTSAEKDAVITSDPENLFRLLEFLVLCMKKGAQILRFYKPKNQTKSPAGETDLEKLFHHLIANVIREINPSACIITDENQIQDESLLPAGLNQIP
jgi:hypothetical protein